ncbi:MAG: ABC transporter permease [candidate division KSB1 bacterium]|nr:ABC transporter permease [candidate division KSB1 bacterium]MDZ7301767.1 ABC transporter permease [candidate division KSB1 bacterium]
MKKTQAESWEKIRAQVYEAMREALITLRSNRLRSGLVILGVLIGVASLMGMVATLAGLEKFIADSISGGQTPILSLSKVDFLAGEGHKEWEKRKNFTIEDAYALQELPHVSGVEVEYGRSVVVKYKDRKAQFIQLAGSNQPLLQVQSISLAEGRYFTESEELHRRNVVVLGDKAAKSLFPHEDPIGKAIRIQGKEYEVIGVFSNRKTIFGGFAENFMVIPYTSFERDFLWWRQGPEINVIVEDVRYIDQVKEDMRALMRMRRKVPLGQPDDFAIIPVEAVIEFTQNITDKIALVLVVLSSIALMVGGIGVMVIMLVSVTERTAEIGIRKAIGATRGQITWQFLIEAATLSGIGGLLGIIIGIGLALGVAKLLGFPFVLPIGWVFVAVFMSASVGLFFGIFPARKAAKLHPIVALRHE